MFYHFVKVYECWFLMVECVKAWIMAKPIIRAYHFSNIYLVVLSVVFQAPLC